MIISSPRSCYREKKGLGVSEVGRICPQGIRTCTPTTCGCTYIRPYQSHPSPAYQGSNHSLHVLKLHGVVSRHSGCREETSAARIIFSFFNWISSVTPAWPLAHPGLRTSSTRPKQLYVFSCSDTPVQLRLPEFSQSFCFKAINLNCYCSPYYLQASARLCVRAALHARATGCTFGFNCGRFSPGQMESTWKPLHLPWVSYWQKHSKSLTRGREAMKERERKKKKNDSELIEAMQWIINDGSERKIIFKR